MEGKKEGLSDVQENQGEIDAVTLEKRIEEAEQADRRERDEDQGLIGEEW